MIETNLPSPPPLRKTLGPSFILLGLALGSGELLLWPYLAATYGLGLLWGAALGVSLQFILNTEAMRYTLAWGESVFVGFRKISTLIPLWFVFSTAIPWSIPGFSSASASIVHTLVPFIPEKFAAIALLASAGLLLSLGSSLYQTMERFQKAIILVGLPFLLLLTALLTSTQDWLTAGAGLIGFGDNWWLFPPGVAIASFLGAFAYAGAGGNLNLAQSYYIKEKGFGMGKHMGKISSLFSKKKEKVSIVGHHFSDSKTNRSLWRRWWKLVNQEHAIVFWGLGLFSIIMLSVLAYSTTYGQAPTQGIGFLFSQADVIGNQTIPLFRVLFLVVGASMLFATQVGVLESSSRIISENLLLMTEKKKIRLDPADWFYISLWIQIGVGMLIYLFGIQEPRLLITVSAILNAAAMMVSFALLLVLNKRHLLPAFQPSIGRSIVLAVAVVIFFGFLAQTVIDQLGK